MDEVDLIESDLFCLLLIRFNITLLVVLIIGEWDSSCVGVGRKESSRYWSGVLGLNESELFVSFVDKIWGKKLNSSHKTFLKFSGEILFLVDLVESATPSIERGDEIELSLWNA